MSHQLFLIHVLERVLINSKASLSSDPLPHPPFVSKTSHCVLLALYILILTDDMPSSQFKSSLVLVCLICAALQYSLIPFHIVYKGGFFQLIKKIRYYKYKNQINSQNHFCVRICTNGQIKNSKIIYYLISKSHFKL